MKRTKQSAWDLSRTLAIVTCCCAFVQAEAQLIGEPPIPPKNSSAERKTKQKRTDVEWLWQYSPPPSEGREHELIQDAHFQPFLEQNFTAPQSFWGLQKDGPRKTLAQTAYDFLTIPGRVVADENRYITVTGSVFHLRTSRGLLFVDLNEAHPLAVFAAIDWIRDSKTPEQPGAEFTLWIFPNRIVGLESNPTALPAPLKRSLTRWMAEPLPGLGTVENVTAAILIDPDGTPHQIPVPRELGN